MGENVPVGEAIEKLIKDGIIKEQGLAQSDWDGFFVVDTASTLVFFAYDKVRNVFKVNGSKLEPSKARALHEWIGERLT